MSEQSEFGVTACDARRLLRKARSVQVFFGDRWRNLAVISKASMQRQLDFMRDDDCIPCELEAGYLTFGGHAAEHNAIDKQQESAR